MNLPFQTHIGMVLVAVNPYQLYPIYGTHHIDKYSQQTDVTLLPPHIFSTAQHAFTSMKRRLQNQSIIIRCIFGLVGTSCHSIEAPSTLMAFSFQNALLLDAFMPIVHTTTIENAERFHKKCVHLKTEPYHISVDSENGGFGKCWRHSYRGRVYILHAQMTIVAFARAYSNVLVWTGKTIVWTRSFWCAFGKNRAFRKRISVDGAS